MEIRTKFRVEKMLAEVYSRSPAPNNEPVGERIKEALMYLVADREHYIEVREKDDPDVGFPEDYGTICKLIPLGKEVSRKQEKNYTEEVVKEYSLMIKTDKVRYVAATTRSIYRLDPTRNRHAFPDYRYVELDDIPPSACSLSPRKIRPVATKRDWKCYTLMFMAFNRYCKERDINTIPHKTERAMIVMGRTPLQTLQIGGEKIPGLLIPLAGSDPQVELREDHRYTLRDEICLFVDVYGPKYLMKHRHIYSYFRKEGCGDTPGACIYEPTIEKQEIDYEYIELEDTPEKMDAYYF